MKVGIYLGDLSPAAGGGFTFQDDVLRAIVQALPDSSLEFAVLSSKEPTGIPPQLASRLSHVQVASEQAQRRRRVLQLGVPGLRFLVRAAGVATRFDKLARRAGVDFVWFVTPYFDETDLPYIFTVWDLQHRVQPWFPEVSSSGRWHYRETNFRTMLSRAVFTIACNSAGAHELERFYECPSERIRILPHPTPAFALAAAGLEKPARPSRLQLPDTFFYYPAQFWPHKNHVGLLRALALLGNRRGDRITLVLSGSDRGNLAYVRAEAERLGLADQVRFVGFVSREELVALYRNALALVYPSYFGPENLPPLEAFALGCPVVAADVHGSREQLGEAALLADPRDFAAWADAMNAVASDAGLRSSLIARGAARARQWTAGEYVRHVLSGIEEFARVRATWP
jgi:glycosyltransferase involved in cell wall biosynthesis